MIILRLRPSATARATLRMTFAISRSRLRTPASCVYERTSSTIASSVIRMFRSDRPWFFICLGMRNRLPISIFSCSV